MKTALLVTFAVLTETAFATIGHHRTFHQLPARQSQSASEQTAAQKNPVQFVLDHYLEIESALANDSMQGVASNASAIGRATGGYSMKMLSPEIAAQADILAETKTLGAARAVFKRLSKSLILYIAQHNSTSTYVQVYCPTTKARWLQKSDKIKNPYMGGSMRSCGTIQKKIKEKTG